MQLSDILAVNAVRAGLKVSGKKRLLQDIAETAANIYALDPNVVLDGLQARELLGPTGVGRGIAIPHARLAGLGGVVGVFVKLDKPVDFESVDRKPVDLVFALLAPEELGVEHLKALARVSRTLRDEAVCTKLRSTNDDAALYAILTDNPSILTT